jgi:inositol transport system permease protein
MTKALSNLDYGQLFRKYGTFAILILLCIVSTILKAEIFLTVDNFISIFVQISMIIVLACGECVLIIGSGVDLSAGSAVAMTGTVMAGVYVATQNVAVAFAVAIMLGIILGFVNGSLITKFDLPPFIVTLGTQILARGIAYVYTNGLPIAIEGDAFKILGQGKTLGIPNPIYVAAVIVAITAVLLNQTAFGRAVYAIGGNSEAARASGIKVKKVIILSYVLMGCLSSIAGYMLMSRINVGQPNAAVNYEFDAIIGVILGGASFSGGVGSIGGAVIGCIIMGVLGNIMNLINVPPNWQYVAKGIVILLAIILDSVSKNVSSKNKQVKIAPHA